MTTQTNTSDTELDPLALDLSPDAAHAPGGVSGAPDPAIIAQFANAFFQALPGGVTTQALAPSPALAPAPSVVTTAAPLVPAKPAFGPPDLPPSTIPSIVPTPTVPQPAGSNAQSLSTGGPGFGPGASHGATGAGEPDVKTPTGFADLAHGLADILQFARPGSTHYQPDAGRAAAPQLPSGAPSASGLSGYAPSQTPTAPGEPSDGYYFLKDASVVPSSVSGAPNPPSHGAPDLIPTGARQPDLGLVGQDLRPQLVPATSGAYRPFDAASIKRDFPILREHVHGKPLIWLDNAATTQKPQAVIDRLAQFYEHENSNIHRAAHALAARATDAYESAREKVRRFLNAGSVKDIIFVRGTTEAINLVAKAWGKQNVREGDEIIVTWLEHHANIVPWQQLCAETGAKLRVVPVDDRGQVILEEYEKLLSSRTKIVSMTQVSNALGTIVPVTEMTTMAKRHGATVLVDGAQSVSHMRTDVQAIGCDFFVFSGHKVFGPTGIGAVYGRPDILAHMPPWQGGGNMIADVTFEKTVYQPAPDRFEAGTGNIADAVGLGAAIDYVEAIGMEVIGRYEHELLVYATDKLLTVPGLKLIGTAAEKASVLSFVLDGCRTQDVGAALDREGIAVRAGHHCAQPILRRFGLESTVRPSLAFYNTHDDVDTLTQVLHRIQSARGYR